jgi:hypothetical protein
VATPVLWAATPAALVVATAAAWRVRAVVGLLAAGLSAGGVTAAAASPATASAALAFAAAFAAISLGATVVGATAGRLLDNQDHDPESR